MKKRMALSVLSAVMILANSMTVMAAPEVVEVNGKIEVFDAEYYAAIYPDVVAAFGTSRDAMLKHYTTYGQSEGRLSYAPGTDVQAILAAQAWQPQSQPAEQSGDEAASFAYLLGLEAENPSIVIAADGSSKAIHLTLSEMLERALLFEQHLVKYPNGATAPEASAYFTEIATYAITGGYNKAAGIPNYYMGDTADVVDRRALRYYKRFVEDNPDSCLGKVVQEYISLLNVNQFKIDGTVEAFYNALPQKLMIGR